MHFFIIPANNCNSNCNYCYSKKDKDDTISKETLAESVLFIRNLVNEQNHPKTQITFHGGEPLLTGTDFYLYAIPFIYETLGGEVNINIQSNLWQLDETLCEIFKKYQVGIGTSLDGPQEINDKQRCTGYYKKTYSAIGLLRKQGMPCGCIATFTRQSANKIEEIFNFFIEHELHFDIHAAVKPLGQVMNEDIFPGPEAFGKLLVTMLDMYSKHLPELKIGTLDTLIKNVANKKSGLCTFTRCLGEYFAISPDGDLYTCNRFVGNKDYCIGNIRDIQSFSDITGSPAWKKQQAWQEWIDNECASCLFREFCHGGCPYAAFAFSGNGSFVKDPHCEAYKMIYNHIIDKGAAEFFSDMNMESFKQSQSENNTTRFLSTPILYLMNKNPHPFDLIQTSKKIITAALLGITGNPEQITVELHKWGIINSFEEKLPMVKRFFHDLSQPAQGFNNLYLHVTTCCNLSCRHCYSYNSDEIEDAYLSPGIILDLIEDACSLSFRKIVLTGGEPLLYPDFEALVNALQKLQNKRNMPGLVLRTNLTTPLTQSLIDQIRLVFDHIIVSIDGSEEMHDKQRGKGSYKKAMSNIGLFDAKTIEEKISLACVLHKQSESTLEIENEKKAVTSLKEKYPFREIRFVPVLPLGRAKNISTHRMAADKISVNEWIRRKYYFRTNCGLGQSVMIDAHGDVYPCHVLKETEKQRMGNIYKEKLPVITQQPVFKQLREMNVNTNVKCSRCDMRYLCGGVCKIWETQDCSDLYDRARFLFQDALELCGLSIENYRSFLKE